jgi:hypothetical protein
MRPVSLSRSAQGSGSEAHPIVDPLAMGIAQNDDLANELVSPVCIWREGEGPVRATRFGLDGFESPGRICQAARAGAALRLFVVHLWSKSSRVSSKLTQRLR